MAVSEGNLPELRQRDAEAGRQGGECRAQGPRIAVRDLERETHASAAGAQEAVGSTLGDRARMRLHQHGVGGALAADEDRVRAHRIRDPIAAVERLALILFDG